MKKVKADEKKPASKVPAPKVPEPPFMPKTVTDPVAFAHLRALYEGLAPEGARDDTAHQRDPLRATPAEALVPAFSAGRLDQVAELLLAHEADVYDAQRGLWSATLAWT